MSNGHGEDAIAARIAVQLSGLAPAHIDHLALVGDLPAPSVMRAVGPRLVMPSGGLIAMGNLRNIVADVRAGLIAHTLRQWWFLRTSRTIYDAVVAIGDMFVFLMALVVKSKTLYVGTAKSVYVAPYGPLERYILKRAARVFVRDEPTAALLRRYGVQAQAPGNVIADFISGYGPRDFQGSSEERLVLFPGSRAGAYADAVFLARVLRTAAAVRPRVRGLLSVAPGLLAETFAQKLQADGWVIRTSALTGTPFEALDQGRPLLTAWTGEFSALLHDATLVLGQAGTANEAAAAAGVPIVAFEERKQKSGDWYRMRQARLLGDALHVAGRDLAGATATVLALLSDAKRRRQMSQIGRQRMGPPGGALRIARQLVDLVHDAPR